MQLPIGLLIYWVSKYEENKAIISGLWYYKEMYVPLTVYEKKRSLSDIKEKRCTGLNIFGTYDQIKDILIQGDLFVQAGNNEISMFNKLINDIETTSEDKAYLFDDVHKIKGTGLVVDTVIEVDETMEDIQEYLHKGKIVTANISENWSFMGDLFKVFKGL